MREGYASATCALACRALSPGEPPGDPRRGWPRRSNRTESQSRRQHDYYHSVHTSRKSCPVHQCGHDQYSALCVVVQCKSIENSGAVFSAGTITNSDAFINNRVFALQEGSQFNNLASGRYSGGLGSIGIAGTFVNEGAVTHSLGHIIVGETGQYIQRQAVGSFATPSWLPSACRDPTYFRALLCRPAKLREK
mgnify:CR=1 FL=1